MFYDVTWTYLRLFKRLEKRFLHHIKKQQYLLFVRPGSLSSSLNKDEVL